MSRAATRQAIATALSTVTGVTGYARRPSVLTEGVGWPQWAGSAYAGGHMYTWLWNILIVLPSADDSTADEFADEHEDQLLEALRPVLFIDETKPAKIDTEGGPVYALLLTGRSDQT